MAELLQVAYDTAAVTLYVVLRNSAGQAYRADTQVFENYSTANLTGTKYALAMTEQGTASRYYTATFPTAITTQGTYAVAVYKQAGGSPAETDTLIAGGSIDWDGAKIITFASLARILGTAPTEGAAGRLAGAFTKFFDKATPTGTINSIPDAVAGAAGGLFIAGTNAATSAPSFTTTFTGNLTGSVGSVAAGGIAASSFVAGAIDAAALAADAGTEIGTAVWATTARTLTAGTNIQLPSNGLANVTAWTVNLTGTLSGNVGGISGTTQTLDALQTALSAAHGAGSWATATGFSTLTEANVRTAVGLAAANLDTQLAALDADILTRATTAGVAAQITTDHGSGSYQTATGFSTLTAADVRTAVGLASANLDTQLAAIQSDTDNIQTRLPAALVSGRIDASVGAYPGNTAQTADVAALIATVGAAGAGLTAITSHLPVAIKKNTALAAFSFVMTDSTTHAPTAGLTVTATRSIDGGAFAACANAAASVSSGVYKIDLAAADLNGNTVTLRFTAAAADDCLVSLYPQT